MLGDDPSAFALTVDELPGVLEVWYTVFRGASSQATFQDRLTDRLLLCSYFYKPGDDEYRAIVKSATAIGDSVMYAGHAESTYGYSDFFRQLEVWRIPIDAKGAKPELGFFLESVWLSGSGSWGMQFHESGCLIVGGTSTFVSQLRFRWPTNHVDLLGGLKPGHNASLILEEGETREEAHERLIAGSAKHLHLAYSADDSVTHFIDDWIANHPRGIDHYARPLLTSLFGEARARALFTDAEERLRTGLNPYASF